MMAKIIEMHPDGFWLTPERACKYFREGRGITKRRLMNKIYGGELKLNKEVKRDCTGWLVFISREMYDNVNHNPLRAA